MRPVERLIDVFTTGESTGEVLSGKILTILAKVGLQLHWLIGQSYDGAGNVRGIGACIRTGHTRYNSDIRHN